MQWKSWRKYSRTPNIVLAIIPANIINFHYRLLMKIFLTFGFGASGDTSQVLIRYASPY
jgi:hypothetical protein